MLRTTSRRGRKMHALGEHAASDVRKQNAADEVDIFNELG
jgi:hypothetical protein